MRIMLLKFLLLDNKMLARTNKQQLKKKKQKKTHTHTKCCLLRLDIRLTKWLFAEMAERKQMGEREAAQIETNRAAAFIAYISTQQMVLLTISAPLHYLHQVFIRAILTYVLGDQWMCFFFNANPVG